MTAFASVVGKKLGSAVTIYPLEGRDAPKPLPVHNEGIYVNGDLIRSFALGCIQPSISGGETTIYDARAATRLLKKLFPEYSDVKTEYYSGSYPGEKATYALVSFDERHRNVLRFSSDRTYNRTELVIPDAIGRYYNSVNEVLDKSVAIRHQWTAGYLIFFNNLVRLHSREPYQGLRQMLRIRFGNKMNAGLEY